MLAYLADTSDRDLLEGTPGVRAHRPAAGSGSTMGGWYSARGIYHPEELGGLPLADFLKALNAEGFSSSNGANNPLHLHPLMNDVDVYGDGKPTRVSRTVRYNTSSSQAVVWGRLRTRRVTRCSS